MKVVKYIFMFSFALILLGIIGRTIIPFWGGNMAFILGVLVVVLVSPIYGVLALVKKQQRIEAAMLLSSVLLIFGVLFKLMVWPFGNSMIIIGSQILLFCSIIILVFSIINKSKLSQSILFAVIGYNSLAYCFKSLLWPGAKMLVISAFVTMVVGLFFAYKNRGHLTFSKAVLSICILLLSLSFITKESTLRERGNRNLATQSSAHHLDYYKYAELLNHEGDTEKAKTNLQKAINTLGNNPNSTYPEDLPENREKYLKVYKEALNMLNTKGWDTYKNVNLEPVSR